MLVFRRTCPVWSRAGRARRDSPKGSRDASGLDAAIRRHLFHVRRSDRRHGQGKHALHRPQGWPRGDRDAPRPRAQARRADQEAGARGQVRRRRLPSRDRRLHGADRRPRRHRHGRHGRARCRPSSARSRTSAARSSMARTSDPNSARSQFFICFKDSNFLDGQYTVWGKVTSGMEFVDKIKNGEPSARRTPRQDDQGPGRGRREGLGVQRHLSSSPSVRGSAPRRQRGQAPKDVSP